jgi:hypothetical protein
MRDAPGKKPQRSLTECKAQNAVDRAKMHAYVLHGIRDLQRYALPHSMLAYALDDAHSALTTESTAQVRPRPLKP